MFKNANLTSSENSKFSKFNESPNLRKANPRLLDLENIRNYINENTVFTSNFLITKKTISKFDLVGIEMSISVRMKN